MKVLLLGSGAREHAVAWKLSQSPNVQAIHCAPGNGGTVEAFMNHPVVADDPEAVLALARELAVDLVFVGPEAPLVAGVADALRAQGILVFGPDKRSAQLEGSKVFAKEFMARHRIPTAGFRVFNDANAAREYVRLQHRPLVVKADGLAAGKGVVVAKDSAEAVAAIDAMMVERVFGSAGDRLVIEDTLRGPEISFHVVMDGKRYLPLAACQDHKRLLDGDRGPNTGGMGAYSPPPFCDAALLEKIEHDVVAPTFHGLLAEGLAYRGVLFIGLMIDAGKPYVLEYNVRFGDPETQVLMTRWGGDVLPLLCGAACGDLADLTSPTWAAPAAMSVVLAARGYPEKPEKGAAITLGVDTTSAHIFHAGTTLSRTGLQVSGGRVLTVTAAGNTLREARNHAYQAVQNITFDGMQFRNDIGHQGLAE